MISLPPGPHGGDAGRLAGLLGVAVNEILDLSVSLNPLAPDPTPVISRHLDAIGRYPDDHLATAALAEVLGVDPARLLLTNGGAEAIALVAQLHPTGWADLCDFSLYRGHLRAIDPDGPRWMSDPHNPTGRLAAADKRAFVRDEAFYPLATGTWTRNDPATIVVGSLTKVFACPGLRIGYVVAPDDGTAERLRELRPRWSVNGLIAEALPELLERADLAAWTVGIAQLRNQLDDLLLHFGLKSEPGSANFLWLPNAPDLRQRLLEHRVLLRSGASFGHPDAVRIAVPSADGLARLETALAANEHLDA
ncbi:MAG TPA: aminotransferase class I/II-fold pyridoxal phosphate-dependent enzyme [Acidimicrobiia bacterium]|nr:aminotransferase class I/II-fold pyridoxal phosphate-dependent enzyme [Acidimicrobiia bacterium]